MQQHYQFDYDCSHFVIHEGLNIDAFTRLSGWWNKLMESFSIKKKLAFLKHFNPWIPMMPFSPSILLPLYRLGHLGYGEMMAYLEMLSSTHRKIS